MTYLIDTDICSYFLRGRYNLDQTFQQKGYDNLKVSIVTVAELKVLAYRHPHSVINLSRIDSLAHLLGVLELDADTWDMYSMTKAETLAQGRPRGDFDILNASIAKQHDLIVVTNNVSHYEGLVQVENWVQS